jgi:hypothetical protein
MQVKNHDQTIRLDDRHLKPVFLHLAANALQAGPDMLDKVHPVKHSEKKRIPGNASLPKIRQFQSGYQTSGVVNLDPVIENENLYIGGAAILSSESSGRPISSSI